MTFRIAPPYRIRWAGIIARNRDLSQWREQVASSTIKLTASMLSLWQLQIANSAPEGTKDHVDGRPQETLRAAFPYPRRAGQAAAGTAQRIGTQHHPALRWRRQGHWRPLQRPRRECRLSGVL